MNYINKSEFMCNYIYINIYQCVMLLKKLRLLVKNIMLKFPSEQTKFKNY